MASMIVPDISYQLCRRINCDERQYYYYCLAEFLKPELSILFIQLFMHLNIMYNVEMLVLTINLPVPSHTFPSSSYISNESTTNASILEIGEVMGMLIIIIYLENKNF